MIFGHLKRKNSEMKRQASPSDCASALKKVTIDTEDSSVRSGTAWSSMQSYASWRSEDSNQDSMISYNERPEPKSTLPRSSNAHRDVFVKKVIDQLKCWMPGTERSPELLALDMARANEAVSKMQLPGGVAYVPVHPSDPLLEIMAYLDVDAIAIALGASYFQRLLEKKPSMMAGARECGWFVEVDDGKGQQMTMMRSVFSENHTGLMVIYAVVVYIAAKYADRIKYKRLLSALLYSLLDSYVSEETACELEARCLSKLDWRLGPLTD
jgi:hypothetical protein